MVGEPIARLAGVASTALASLGFAVILTACTAAAPQPDLVIDYSPPAWMAESAQWQERYGQFAFDCMTAAGYDVSLTPDGGIQSTSPDGLSEDEMMAATKAEEAQAWDCYVRAQAELGQAPALSDPELYAQMLDTLECLGAQGYTDLGEPPSEQAWIERAQSGDGPWAPYEQLYAEHPDITEADWYALKEVCVEGGVTFSTDFREPDE